MDKNPVIEVILTVLLVSLSFCVIACTINLSVMASNLWLYTDRNKDECKAVFYAQNDEPSD